MGASVSSVTAAVIVSDEDSPTAEIVKQESVEQPAIQRRRPQQLTPQQHLEQAKGSVKRFGLQGVSAAARRGGEWGGEMPGSATPLTQAAAAAFRPVDPNQQWEVAGSLLRRVPGQTQTPPEQDQSEDEDTLWKLQETEQRNAVLERENAATEAALRASSQASLRDAQGEVQIGL